MTAAVPPTIGTAYDIEVAAQPGYATGSALAFPWLASRAAAVRLPPFGILGVDPATIVPLTPVQLPVPAGIAHLQLAIPNALRLVGATFFLQTLVVDASGSMRLTNTMRDTVR